MNRRTFIATLLAPIVAPLVPTKPSPFTVWSFPCRAISPPNPADVLLRVLHNGGWKDEVIDLGSIERLRVFYMEPAVHAIADKIEADLLNVYEGFDLSCKTKAKMLS